METYIEEDPMTLAKDKAIEEQMRQEELECPMKGRMSQCSSEEICYHNQK